MTFGSRGQHAARIMPATRSKASLPVDGC
jgi:hypothetical protein